MLRGMPMMMSSIFRGGFPQPPEKSCERFCGNVFQRRSNHLHLVAHRDADAFRSVIEGEDAHCGKVNVKRRPEHRRNLAPCNGDCSAGADQRPVPPAYLYIQHGH
jgi:hypothetical protein